MQTARIDVCVESCKWSLYIRLRKLHAPSRASITSTGVASRALARACLPAQLDDSASLGGNKLKAKLRIINGNMINQLRVLLLLHCCGGDKRCVYRAGNAPGERMGENPRASSRRAAAPPSTADPRSPEVTRPIGRYDARRDMAAALSYY